jgi:hypothetical protein
MGLEWLNQKVGQASDWIRQTAGTVSRGADWLNQNVIQPGAKVAKTFGYGDVADTLGHVGAASQGVANIGKMVNKGRIDLNPLKEDVKTIHASVDHIRKKYRKR